MKWQRIVVVSCLTLAVPSFAAESPKELYERGLLRKLAGQLESRLAANANDGEALTWLARVRVQQERFDEGIALAERATKVSPNDAEAHFALAEGCGSKAQSVGVLKAASLARRFKKETDAALALDPKHVDARIGLIEFYRQAPGMFGGDKKKAAALTEELVRDVPEVGWLRKARAAARNSDTVQVEACYRKAVAAERNGSSARIALASWLAPGWRKPAESERLANDVLASEPWNANAWSILAVLAAKQRRWNDLEATLARAEAAMPDNLLPHYQAARQMLVDQEEYPRAEKYFRRYLTQQPEYGAPTHAHARWRLGLVLEKAGRKPEAIAELETALRLKPDLEDAKKDLKRLRG